MPDSHTLLGAPLTCRSGCDMTFRRDERPALLRLLHASQRANGIGKLRGSGISLPVGRGRCAKRIAVHGIIPRSSAREKAEMGQCGLTRGDEYVTLIF